MLVQGAGDHKAAAWSNRHCESGAGLLAHCCLAAHHVELTHPTGRIGDVLAVVATTCDDVVSVGTSCRQLVDPTPLALNARARGQAGEAGGTAETSLAVDEGSA